MEGRKAQQGGGSRERVGPWSDWLRDGDWPDPNPWPSQPYTGQSELYQQFHGGSSEEPYWGLLRHYLGFIPLTLSCAASSQNLALDMAPQSTCPPPLGPAPAESLDTAWGV